MGREAQAPKDLVIGRLSHPPHLVALHTLDENHSRPSLFLTDTVKLTSNSHLSPRMHTRACLNAHNM